MAAAPAAAPAVPAASAITAAPAADVPSVRRNLDAPPPRARLRGGLDVDSHLVPSNSGQPASPLGTTEGAARDDLGRLVELGANGVALAVLEEVVVRGGEV